jgi:hypothetical protein
MYGRWLSTEEVPMKHLILVAAAALTICSAGPAAAAAPGPIVAAPFGCDARAGQTCFFKIYYTPRGTRIVQLPGGTREAIPGLQIGTDHYCLDVGKPPANKCTQKAVNANYNN